MTTPNAQYRGPGGLFSTPGTDRAVLTTHVAPSGIDEFLPALGATITNPIFSLFTGVSDETGSEPEQVCDPAPTALMTSGTLTAMFGRIIRETPTIDYGRLPQTIAGEPTDLSLLAAFGRGGSLAVSTDANGIINDAVRGAMFTVGTQLQRKITKLLWSGNPAANNLSKPGYLEFPGLDKQIVTGQTDAQTGVALPAADSYVKDAASSPLGTYDIVAELQAMMYVLKANGDRMFGSVQHALAMTPEMFHALTDVWPIQYNTQAAANLLISNGVAVNVDGGQLVSARDAMRASASIVINGTTYPVILDDGIASSVTNGLHKSSIYALPLSVMGGFPVLSIEYLDFSKAGALSVPGFTNQDFWTDGGRVLWSAVQQKTCFSLTARIEPRIVLRTPWLAGKIQNVGYVPAGIPRSPFPSSPYHVAGSIYGTPEPSPYAVWQ